MKGQAFVVTKDVGTASNAHVIRTMLDMVAYLERRGESIVSLVLDGEFARDHEIVAFLYEAYPSINIVTSASDQPGTGVTL
jgi:hypothetical protein